MKDSRALVGIVLAGGKSTRMGFDKAFLRFKAQPQERTLGVISEKTLLDRALELLALVVPHVYVSGRDNWGTYPGIRDCTDRIGPMGGIISAIRQTQSPCLVISCDLPFLSQEMLQRLVAQREKCGSEAVMTTFAYNSGYYIETLVSIYEPKALTFLEKSAQSGEYSLKRAIPCEARNLITHKGAPPLDFFNLNCPDDLEVVRNILKVNSPEEFC